MTEGSPPFGRRVTALRFQSDGIFPACLQMLKTMASVTPSGSAHFQLEYVSLSDPGADFFALSSWCTMSEGEKGATSTSSWEFSVISHGGGAYVAEKCVTRSASGMVQYVGGVSSRIFLMHTLGFEW